VKLNFGNMWKARKNEIYFAIFHLEAYLGNDFRNRYIVIIIFNFGIQLSWKNKYFEICPI